MCSWDDFWLDGADEALEEAPILWTGLAEELAEDLEAEEGSGAAAFRGVGLELEGPIDDLLAGGCCCFFTGLTEEELPAPETPTWARKYNDDTDVTH